MKATVLNYDLVRLLDDFTGYELSGIMRSCLRDCIRELSRNIEIGENCGWQWGMIFYLRGKVHKERRRLLEGTDQDWVDGYLVDRSSGIRVVLAPW